MLKAVSNFAIASVLTFGSTTFAALLTLTPGEQKIADINIAKSAEISTASDKISLNSLGAGLRNKKVVFVNVKVYVAQLFVADPSNFAKGLPLDAVKDQTSAALRMTFLRDVDAEKIQASFEESFKANSVDIKDPNVAQLLAAVKAGGDIKSGQTITTVSIKKDKSERILVETADSKVTEISGDGIIAKAFSLWFGKTTDNGVEEMKKSILK